MVTIKAQTLKGFRDFEPEEAQKRQYVINRLRSVFESYGFEPLETPALEYERVLLGKYGNEGDKLMYRFEDNGKRRVALRYDQTVPLARYIGQNYQTIAFPFKRYQIQPVWRAENTQKGRYREFLQCDVDTVGTGSETADAEIISLVSDCYKALGFNKIKILLNDKAVFENVPAAAVLILDKLKKIGSEQVKQELKKKDFDENILDQIKVKKLTNDLQTVISLTEKLGVDRNSLIFEPTLARGLDYYTGVIIEVEVDGYSGGALGGGGRYDNLIGMFAGKQIPAVGFAFGFDRTIEAMDQQKLFPAEISRATAKVLVTSLPEYEKNALELATKLRKEQINVELYLEPVKLEKQLKYADKKGIPYTAIIGSNEAKTNKIALKNMKTQQQQTLTIDSLVKLLKAPSDYL